MCESRPSLYAARQRVGRIARPSGAAAHGHVATGHAALDAALGGGFAKGRMHELFASTPDDATAAAGFAAMIALLAGSPIVWLRTERAERMGGRLDGPGLAGIGADPGAMTQVLTSDETTLLRCANDAARCQGLAAIVVESWGGGGAFDLTVSRRLTLAAERAGVTLLMLRIDAQATPSAAATRWAVRAAPSRALEAEAPGHPTFDLELLRHRAGPAGMRWRLEWNRDERRFVDPALSGAVVSRPAGRTAATGGHRPG